jgi:predicted O-methyltransferase YrrM
MAAHYKRNPQLYVPRGLASFEPLRTRTDLFAHSIGAVTLPGDFAEFGVYSGKSARDILKSLPKNRTLWLFDSFEGLPEAWDQGDAMQAKGTFNLQGKEPQLGDPRAKVVRGWFEDTVKRWANTQCDHLAFVHIDSDLYSSCKTVLEGIEQLIGVGTIIQFDEIQGYPNYMKDEYRALSEAPFKWEWIARTNMYHAAIRVTAGR